MENDELLNAGQEGNYRLDIIDTNQKVIHSTLYRQHLHDVHRFCTIRPPCFCCRCCGSVETLVTIHRHCATLAVVSLVTATVPGQHPFPQHHRWSARERSWNLRQTRRYWSARRFDRSWSQPINHQGFVYSGPEVFLNFF